MSKKKVKNTKEKRAEKAEAQVREQEETIDEFVDDIYEEEGELVQPIRYGYTSRFMSMLAVLIVAFLAGIVGELAINNYMYYKGYDLTRLWQPEVEPSDEQQIIIFNKDEAQELQHDTKILLEATQQSVVGIYQKRGGSALVDQLYQPDDKIGNALVMTSDGWLVTTTTGMPTEPGLELIIIGPDNEQWQVEKIMLDDVSDVVFLKIDAQNLKVTKFADTGMSYPGLQVMAVGKILTRDTVQSVRTSLLETQYRYIRGFADQFDSTETYTTYARLNEYLPSYFAGSPVIDFEGGIVGLYYGAENEATVIPASHFIDSFNQLLKTQKIEYPFVGLRYISLASTVGVPEQMGEGLDRGALIFGDDVHAVTAVAAESPAQEAGLQLGDIVLKVNDDPVDARHTLTELLFEYAIGDVVTLQIQNGGEVRQVELALVAPLEEEGI